MIVADVHALNAFRVVRFLRDKFKIDAKARRQWFNYWLIEGLDALELWLTAADGVRRYCVGDAPTIADICLVPQLEIARRNGIDLEDFPRLSEIGAACTTLDAFRNAHPDQQMDSQP